MELYCNFCICIYCNVWNNPCSFDGYSRALNRTVELLFGKNNANQPKSSRKLYSVFLVVLASGSLITVLQFGDNLKELIDFATILSFVIAPVIAIFNYRLVTGKIFGKITSTINIVENSKHIWNFIPIWICSVFYSVKIYFKLNFYWIQISITYAICKRRVMNQMSKLMPHCTWKLITNYKLEKFQIF